jgi:hypothetical protein
MNSNWWYSRTAFVLDSLKKSRPEAGTSLGEPIGFNMMLLWGFWEDVLEELGKFGDFDKDAYENLYRELTSHVRQNREALLSLAPEKWGMGGWKESVEEGIAKADLETLQKGTRANLIDLWDLLLEARDHYEEGIAFSRSLQKLGAEEAAKKMENEMAPFAATYEKLCDINVWIALEDAEEAIW